MIALVEPLTIGGVRVVLAGMSVGFAAGGAAKASGRTLAARGEARVLAVKGG